VGGRAHTELYLQELGWAENFEGVSAQIIADFTGNHDPNYDRGWIAEKDGWNASQGRRSADRAG
jgi:hypothetical protein